MLQNGSFPASLGAAENFHVLHDQVESIPSAKTQKLSRLVADRGPPWSDRKSCRTQYRGDSFMYSRVQSLRLFCERMSCGNNAGIGQFVIMDDRATA